MLLNIDWVSIILALLLGYVEDLILPKYYFYEDTIVGVYKKYQCPTHCLVNHNHFVYYTDEIKNESLMSIDKPDYKKLKKVYVIVE